jgi:hypothetical protein
VVVSENAFVAIFIAEKNEHRYINFGSHTKMGHGNYLLTPAVLYITVSVYRRDNAG